MAENLLSLLREIPDPRIERCKKHPLESIILLSVISVLCGVEGWEHIELFGTSKEPFLSTLIPLPNGIPSHDTIERVFKRLEPGCFESVFRRWATGLMDKTAAEQIAIDGKTVRGSKDSYRQKYALHLVSAWACENELVLGQLKTQGKIDEMDSIRELLTMLDLTGSLVSIDAIACQKDIAQKIVEQEANYVLALKENQPELHEQCLNLFAKHPVQDTHQWVEKSHGRIETRTCSVITQLGWLEEELKLWPSLKAVVRVESKREINGVQSNEARYYISSLSNEAEFFNLVVRRHWNIENKLHWTLDMIFGEDASRKRIDHAPQNFALIRKFAINIVKRDKTPRRSLILKRKMAGWDDKYLIRLLKLAAI